MCGVAGGDDGSLIGRLGRWEHIAGDDGDLRHGVYGRLEGCRGLHERETRSQGMIRSSRRWEVQKQQGRSEGAVSDRRQAGSERPVGAMASRLFVRFFSSIEGRPGKCVREGATPADPAVLDNPCDFDRRTRPLGVLYCRGPMTLVNTPKARRGILAGDPEGSVFLGDPAARGEMKGKAGQAGQWARR